MEHYNHQIMHDDGFSLLETLIVITMLGIMSVGMLQMTDNILKSFVNFEAKSEIIIIKNEISGHLLDSVACKETLGVSEDLSVKTQINLSSIKDKHGALVYMVYNSGNKALYGNRKIKITSIKLKAYFDVIRRSYKSGFIAQKGTLEPVTIEVRLDKINPLANQVSTTYRFPIKVQTNPLSGEVLFCYSNFEGIISTALSRACSMIGGMVDSMTSMCNLKNYPSTESKQDAVSTKYLNHYVVEKIQPLSLANKECPDGKYLKGMSSTGIILCSDLPIIERSAHCLGEWVECSVGCGGGVQSYQITSPVQGSGQNCPHANGKTRNCNTHECRWVCPSGFRFSGLSLDCFSLADYGPNNLCCKSQSGALSRCAVGRAMVRNCSATTRPIKEN